MQFNSTSAYFKATHSPSSPIHMFTSSQNKISTARAVAMNIKLYTVIEGYLFISFGKSKSSLSL